MSNIQLLQGDCLNSLSNIADDSVDCVITSPPYNVDLGNNKYNKNGYNVYNDNRVHSEYILWLKNIFSIIYKKVVFGGRVCINVGDGRNGAVPTHSDIIQFMTKEIGYILISTLIWNKGQIGNRTAWGSFMSPSSPSYPCPFEYILIFGKGCEKLQHKGISDITKEDFITNAFALWTFPPEQRMNEIGHPAVFPLELPKRLIQMNSYVGDVVLDPFMGSGSTGVAAVNTNRNFIGMELDEAYFKIASERIEQAQKFPGTVYKKPKPTDSKKLF